jgi:hypothetical protein
MVPGIKLSSDKDQKYLQGKLSREFKAHALIFPDGMKHESMPMPNRHIGEISYLHPDLQPLTLTGSTNPVD